MKERLRHKIKLLIMLGLTFAFFLVEIVVGYMTGSLALVSDSFHMISDVLALIIGFVCLWLSTKESKTNTYGWARTEIIGALINSVFLIALCFSIFVEAVQRMVSPEEIHNPDLLLVVGGVGLGVNLIGLLIFCNETVGHHGHSHGGDAASGGHGHSHGGVAASGGHGHSHDSRGSRDDHSHDDHSHSHGNHCHSHGNHSHSHGNHSHSHGNHSHSHGSHSHVDLEGTGRDGGPASCESQVALYPVGHELAIEQQTIRGAHLECVIVEGGKGGQVTSHGGDATGGHGHSHGDDTASGGHGRSHGSRGSRDDHSHDDHSHTHGNHSHSHGNHSHSHGDHSHMGLEGTGRDGDDSSDEGFNKGFSDELSDDQSNDIMTTMSNIVAGPVIDVAPDDPEECTPKKKKVKKSKSGSQMNIQGVFLHILGDALGSVVVIISGLLIKYFDEDWVLRVDPALSLLMVIIILTSTIPLFKQSVLILLQNVPKNMNVTNLVEKMKTEVAGLSHVHDLHVWQLVGTRVIASMHIRCTNLTDYVQTSKKIKTFFHDNGIHSSTIQPEFLEHKDKPTTRECYLECGPDLQCFASTCCSAKRRERSEIDAVTHQPTVFNSADQSVTMPDSIPESVTESRP